MSERSGEVLVYALLLILPIAALLARRPPAGRTLLYILAWIAIFAIGALVIGQRDRFGMLGADRQVDGTETRINMAADGHFWADVTIDGVPRRMLVDSGATTSAISDATARDTALEQDSPFPVVLNTANGRVTARTATARRVVLGGIVAHDLPVVVSPAFGSTDVLGMNFLSRLASWKVEGRTLILNPQTASM